MLSPSSPIVLHPSMRRNTHARRQDATVSRGKAFARGPVVYEGMANGLEHWMTAVSVRMPYLCSVNSAR